jgi:hypothetical protein
VSPRPSSHRGLRGHTGTSTVPATSEDSRSQRDLLSDAAYERLAFMRAIERFTCPACSAAPMYECQTKSGRPFKAERVHKPREDLLWSQPCPECGAALGEFCHRRERGVNHEARDRLIHQSVPGSEYHPPKPPAPPGTAKAALARFAQLAREGRAPWQLTKDAP